MTNSIAAESDTPRNRPWLTGGVIVLLCLIAYAPFLGNGYIWDDSQYVFNNKTLRNVDGLRKIWLNPAATPQYYPLVHTSFWIEYHLWELNPAGYHAVNILLHAISCVILWRLLVRLSVPGAFWAAAIFAVHPVHVESVAWITERKNVLSGLFYLLAAMAYFKFDPPSATTIKRRWGYYILAVALFLCSLLSKTVTCTLPAAIALVYWWKRPRLSLRDILPLLPLVAAGAAMGLITVYLEKVKVGAVGADWSYSPPERFIIAGRALWFYAGKLLFPYPLIFIYERWDIDGAAWWQYLFPALALVVMVALFLLRRQIGKGPLVAVLFFAGTLSPALGFFNVYPMRFSFVADHFQYLASIGIIALCAAILRTVWLRFFRRTFLVYATSAAILGVLVVLTWRLAPNYYSASSLWTSVIAKNDKCWLAYGNLSSYYAKNEDPDKAMAHLVELIQLAPHVAEAHYNYANLLSQKGRLVEAVNEYRLAIHYEPRFALAYHNLGNTLVDQGRIEEGIAAFLKALEINPKLSNTINDLGAAYLKVNRSADAESCFLQASRLDPRNYMFISNYVNQLVETGRRQQAEDFLRGLLRSDRDNRAAQQKLDELGVHPSL